MKMSCKKGKISIVRIDGRYLLDEALGAGSYGEHLTSDCLLSSKRRVADHMKLCQRRCTELET